MTCTALACADGSPGVALFHDDPEEAPEIMLTQGGHAPPLALTLDVWVATVDREAPPGHWWTLDAEAEGPTTLLRRVLEAAEKETPR